MDLEGKIWSSILILGFTIVAFFWTWNWIIGVKSENAAKTYCKNNKLKFIRVKRYELHYRLYFEKNGISSWVNYETDNKYTISWKNLTPDEKIEKIKLKK